MNKNPPPCASCTVFVAGLPSHMNPPARGEKARRSTPRRQVECTPRACIRTKPLASNKRASWTKRLPCGRLRLGDQMTVSPGAKSCRSYLAYVVLPSRRSFSTRRVTCRCDTLRRPAQQTEAFTTREQCLAAAWRPWATAPCPCRQSARLPCARWRRCCRPRSSPRPRCGWET